MGTLIEHRFELPPLVFAGLRETSDAGDAGPAAGRERPPRRSRLDPAFARFRAEFEVVFGSELPGAAGDGRCDLGSLVMRPDASALVYALEALLMAGLASVTRPRRRRPSIAR